MRLIQWMFGLVHVQEIKMRRQLICEREIDEIGQVFKLIKINFHRLLFRSAVNLNETRLLD